MIRCGEGSAFWDVDAWWRQDAPAKSEDDGAEPREDAAPDSDPFGPESDW